METWSVDLEALAGRLEAEGDVLGARLASSLLAQQQEATRYREAIQQWCVAKANCGDYYAESFAFFDTELAAIVGLNEWGLPA